MEIELTIYCAFCEKNTTSKINIPKGWALKYDVIDKEMEFCPDHVKIKEFSDAQCPGCVGGWGDCGLFSDFAYKKQNLSESDFIKIRKGICPRRTNGTFSFNSNTGTIDEMDLSNIANSESGITLEKAIKEYWKKYPNASK